MKTISELYEEWANEKRVFVKESTVAIYILHIENHILPTFGKMDVDEIDESFVQEFVINQLIKGLSPKTIHDQLIVLKMILRWGCKKKYWYFVDLDWKIKYPTTAVPEKKIKTLSLKDQQKLLDYILGHFTTRNFGIYLTLFTGVRIGELCAMQWKDINTVDGLIEIRKTIERIYVRENGKRHTKVIIGEPKTVNSVRDIPIAHQVMKLVKPLKKVVNPEFYVLTNEEKPTEPRTYRNYFRDVLEKLDIPPLNYHGLRHTFATRCLEGKADIKTVSSILGHANISTTLNLYMHPDQNMKKNAIERMGNLFK